MKAIAEAQIVAILSKAEDPLCKHDFARIIGANIATIERALAKLRKDGTKIRVAEWRRVRLTGPYCPYYVKADGKPNAEYPMLGSLYDRATTLPKDPLSLFIMRHEGSRKAA